MQNRNREVIKFSGREFFKKFLGEFCLAVYDLFDLFNDLTLEQPPQIAFLSVLLNLDFFFQVLCSENEYCDNIA